ncbi:filamentous hemagglutinin N-terminal domain-containing protein [Rhodanobacter sp. Si-c]|uniref:Filamentous hemagglutinin N-terminal domain-containing protein n=1 Tax=Rhodanobacter lycopersici TaxID=3162487 RepID=A0ABV3QJ01_9GAMM
MNTPRRRHARNILFCSVAIALAAPHNALAASATLPTGGVVRSGQASIAASGSGALTISQSSKAAIIDWSGFSLGQGGAVQFNNGSGATLNRVLSGGPISSINGLLSATGSVYLINLSGVIIGKNEVVKVGGTFAASTLDVDDSAFLNGGSLTFSGPSKASVVNLGKVEALGGDVVLAAAVVKNAGFLQAPNGDVGLLAGYTVTMKDLADKDGLFTVDFGGAGASVINQGVISAAAELRANGGNIYALAGDTASVIKATQVSNQGGKIFLTAPGGAVNVAPGVTPDAFGTGFGSGGHILVDSANTSFHGTALAKGGALGGDGGLIETSGDVLDFSGAKADITAAHGATGTWLLDPYDLTVDTTGAQALENGLLTNNVTLQTTASSATTGYGTVNASGLLTLVKLGSEGIMRMERMR